MARGWPAALARPAASVPKGAFPVERPRHGHRHRVQRPEIPYLPSSPTSYHAELTISIFAPVVFWAEIPTPILSLTFSLSYIHTHTTLSVWRTPPCIATLAPRLHDDPYRHDFDTETDAQP